MLKYIKKASIALFLALFILNFASCTVDKAALTADEFAEIADKCNMQTYSSEADKEQNESKNTVIAWNENFQVEYNEFSDEESAKQFYEIIKNSFSFLDVDKSEKSDKTAASFTQQSDKEYFILKRNGTVVIYTTTEVENKNAVDEFFKQI